MQKLRFFLMLSAILILGVAVSRAEGRKDCPEFEKHKCAKHLKLTPTEDLVCIRGQVKGPTKVTFHFKRSNGTYYREPIARTYNGSWWIKFSRHTFEQINKEGGIIKICAGEKGEIGARFEKVNVDEHLRNGPKCESAPVCLFPGLQCPSVQQ